MSQSIIGGELMKITNMRDFAYGCIFSYVLSDLIESGRQYSQQESAEILLIIIKRFKAIDNDFEMPVKG